MKAISAGVLACVLSLTCVTLIEAAGSGSSGGSARWDAAGEHGFYVGFAFGPAQLSTADGEREMDGLNFLFEVDDDDIGMAVFAGYWISDFVCLEAAIRDYGTVGTKFEFSNPHDGTSGTGEAEVAITAVSLSLMMGYDIQDSLQLYARIGAQMWEEQFDSRFDIVGQPALYRDTEDSGTGLIYGGGISWRFHSTCRLHLQYDHAELDDDDIGMTSLAFSYDFVGLLH